MGNKRAGERDTEEQEMAAAAAGTPTPDAKKRRSGSPSTTDGASGLCDDVVGNILARVPARTAVASMALSRRHRRLIRSPEFRSLHRQLAPPLPAPHIAYLVTATVRTRRDGKDEVPASAFQGFHVAGAGGFNGNAPAPMRSLAGPRFLDVHYVNTCNGVVLLAGHKYSDRDRRDRCRCVLWNPAVADAVEEVPVPGAGADADASTRAKEYRALGLGYGCRSKTYKLLLLSRRSRGGHPRGDRRSFFDGHKDGTGNYSLVTYALADPAGRKPRELELPAAAVRGDDFKQHSLYMDGKIYLLLRDSGTNPAAILAFDVDDETVTSIDLPVAHDPDGNIELSGLMELSGRPCVATDYGGGCALWLLSVDHQWHRRCLIGELSWPEGYICPASIVGVWDCGGVLVVCYKDVIGDPDRLFLYNLTTGKMFRASLEGVVTLGCSKSSDLAICWGYRRPTLEAPRSVVGKQLKQDDDGCRECSTYIMEALKPVAEQDRKEGQKATLNTVCFMDFLVRIMEKLPKDMQQVLEMKMVDSDDPDFTFENVLFRENV